MGSVHQQQTSHRRVNIASPSSGPVSRVTREDLIADLQRLYRNNGTVTRRIYRVNGKFTERQWERFFPTFGDFLSAANVPSQNHAPSPNNPNSPTTVISESSEINGTQWSITLPKTTIHTLDELIAHCKVDLTVWEVQRFVVNKWEVGAVLSATGQANDKRIVTENLFQVKATLVRKVKVEAAIREIAALKEQAKASAHSPHDQIASVVTNESGNMLEIAIVDHHFGKLAWGRETGYENYDTTIAERLFLEALETLIERASHYTFEQVLFVVGNDLLNSDDQDGRTTKGTYVSTDGRYQKTFAVVRQTITYAIQRLREIAPVKVMVVSGNHDELSAWHLGDSLECYFANYDDVEIDNEPTARKYHRFGNVLLMFTHGDKGRRTDYPLLMATEQSAMFGETKYREVHTGHTHQTKTEEMHGVRVRVLPALCPPDAWHSENGFVGNLRNAEAYIWNKDEGLVGQVFYNDRSSEGENR